ncbi:MAG: hypothetical protein EOP42_08115 [Sphingobacteriaceae bacterium]|nr:MAG: hypothetical protein EOP42_08115 [Sphingobacteriaceae bacterium]
MAEIKALLDAFGVIREANKILPSIDSKLKFLEALAELEDNNAHKNSLFPKIRLHKVKGIKQTIYRADIDKMSGWRLHVQYINQQLHLKDVIDGQLHDDVIRVIQSKKNRYE